MRARVCVCFIYSIYSRPFRELPPHFGAKIGESCKDSVARNVCAVSYPSLQGGVGSAAIYTSHDFTSRFSSVFSAGGVGSGFASFFWWVLLVSIGFVSLLCVAFTGFLFRPPLGNLRVCSS